jgi:hypothetical protein
MPIDPPKGIEVELFIALLSSAFGAGAGVKEITPEALRYPLEKYRKNIERLAKEWPSGECDMGLGCAHLAGKKAAAHAEKLFHPGKIDEASIQNACMDLEKESSAKGVICSRPL